MPKTYCVAKGLEIVFCYADYYMLSMTRLGITDLIPEVSFIICTCLMQSSNIAGVKNCLSSEPSAIANLGNYNDDNTSTGHLHHPSELEQNHPFGRAIIEVFIISNLLVNLLAFVRERSLQANNLIPLR